MTKHKFETTRWFGKKHHMKPYRLMALPYRSKAKAKQFARYLRGMFYVRVVSTKDGFWLVYARPR